MSFMRCQHWLGYSKGWCNARQTEIESILWSITQQVRRNRFKGAPIAINLFPRHVHEECKTCNQYYKAELIHNEGDV